MFELHETERNGGVKAVSAKKDLENAIERKNVVLNELKDARIRKLENENHRLKLNLAHIVTISASLRLKMRLDFQLPTRITSNDKLSL